MLSASCGDGEELRLWILREIAGEVAVGLRSLADYRHRRVKREVEGHEHLIFGEALPKALRLAVLRNVRPLADVELGRLVEMDDGVGKVLRREDRLQIHRVQVRFAADGASLQFEQEDITAIRRLIDGGAGNRDKSRLYALRFLVEQNGCLGLVRLGQGERIEMGESRDDSAAYVKAVEEQEGAGRGKVVLQPAHPAGAVVEEHPERRMVEPVVPRGFALLRVVEKRTGLLDFRLCTSLPLPRQTVLSDQDQPLGAEPMPFHIER